MSTLYHCNQLPTTSGIYRIRCVPTDKFYIGSAINLRRRWVEHRSHLSRNIHANSKLQNAWNKHSEAAFIFEIIELVLIPEMLIPREQHWIDTLKPIFNIAPKAGSRLGTKASPETIEKLRQCNKGRKYSPEFGANITHRQLGRKLSDNTRKKIGDAQRGIPRPERRGEKHTPEHIEKHRQAMLGHKQSEETKRKRADSLRGGKRSPETREKMRLAALGHTVSPETGAKISAANTGRKNSEEICAKLSKIQSTRKRSPEEYASRRKTLILTDPNGTEYVVHGIHPFCIEHGLDSSAIAKVVRGKYKHHRGWTAKYPDPTEN